MKTKKATENEETPEEAEFEWGREVEWSYRETNE